MTTPNHDLLSMADIARIAGVTPQAVSNWRRRFPKFPQPVTDKGGSGPLFDGAGVERWLSLTGKLSPTKNTSPLSVADLFLNAQMAEDQRYVMAALAAPALASIGMEALMVAREQGTISAVLVAIVRQAADEVGLFGQAYDQVIAAAESIPELALAALSDPIVADAGDCAVIDSLMNLTGTIAQFSTPEPLRNLMVAMAGQGTRILDPCAGSGVLLATAARSTEYQTSLSGSDIDPVQAVAGYLRLKTVSEHVHMKWTDALHQDPFEMNAYDTVLIDPPLGSRLRGTTQESSARKSRASNAQDPGDAAWLQYAVRHLAPNGTAVVVTSAHLLTRGGAHANERREVLASAFVDTIVMLPSMSRAIPMPVVLWVLRSEPNDLPVVLIDAQSARSTWNSDASRFAREIKAAQQSARQDGVSTIGAVGAVAVPVHDLMAVDTPLIPAYWIERAARPTLPQIKERFEMALATLVQARGHADGLADTESFRITQENVDFLGLEQLRKERRIHVSGGIRRIPANEGGVVKLIQAQHLYTWDDEGTPEVRVEVSVDSLTKPGDVIAKLEGDPIAIVDHEGGHAIEAPLIALTISPEEKRTTPALLAHWLSSPEVASLATGATLRRINPRHIRIPLFDPQVARDLTKTILDLDLRVAASEALAQASRDIRTWTVSAAAAGLIALPLDYQEKEN